MKRKGIVNGKEQGMESNRKKNRENEQGMEKEQGMTRNREWKAIGK